MPYTAIAKWAGTIVFAIALLLRLIGIGWGLPDEHKHFSLHPDEPVILGVAMQIDLAKGKVDPGFYNYGTLYLTLLNIGTKVVDGYSPLPDQPTSRQVDQRTRTYHMIGRLISAFAGAGLAWVVLLLGFRVGGERAGWFSGLAVAFCPVLSIHSRFQTVDMLATLFVALALLYALKLLVDGDPKLVARWALLAGLYAGLSAGTKYSGILAVTAPLMALLLMKPAGWVRLTGVCLVACLAGFVVGTPGVILNPGQFWQDFRYEMLHTSTGHGLVFAETPSGFVLHIGHLLWGVGAITTLLGVFGLGHAAWMRHRWVLVVAPFFLITYILIGRAEVKFIRYAFPLIPVVAMGFGYAAALASESQTPWVRFRTAMGILGLGGLGGGGLASAVVVAQNMAGLDPRDEAAAFLRSEGAGKSVGIVADPWFYTVTVNPFTAAPRALGFERQWQLIEQTTEPADVRLVQSRAGTVRTNWDLKLLTNHKPDYVAYSSFEANDVERILRGNPGSDPDSEWNRAKAFFIALQKDYQFARIFGAEAAANIELPNARPDPLLQVHDVMYVRPAVWIWKRKTPS